MRLPAEQRDLAPVLVRHDDVVDARLAGQRPLHRFRHEHVARAARRQVIDRAAGAHGIEVMRITGERERAVGQHEDIAAVAGTVAIQHVLAHPHGHARVAGPDGVQRHAQRLARRVAFVHRLAGQFGQPLRITVHGCVLLPGWPPACGAAVETRGSGPRHTRRRGCPARPARTAGRRHLPLRRATAGGSRILVIRPHPAESPALVLRRAPGLRGRR